MGSNQKQTRQMQKEEFEQLLAARKAVLTEKGIEKQNLKKDNVVKHLQAQLRRTDMAIASINAIEKKLEQVKQKQAQTKKMAADKPKSKKQKPAPVPPKKEKKKTEGKKPPKNKAK